MGNLANNFSDSWEELSYSQKEAAEWNNGSYLLLAGPGSGKTRVLTCRIARILNLSEGSRFRLLCLTFTNKAADEMRRRIIDFVPTEENRLFIGTFHSFCADILRQHGIHLGIRPNFEIYSQEVDLQAVLFEAEQKVKKEIDTTFTVKALPVIKRLKSLLITPERSSDLFSDKSLGLYIAKVYSAYEEELASMNALDFNSLIQNAYILFIRYPSIAKRFRTVYKYLCIDEFQDTNLAQYNFIRAFTGNDYKNIFVVADDDQIIYQWNGASYNRLEAYKKDYSPTVGQLPINYRCPPEVVAIANLLISNNFLRSANKKPSVASRPSSGGNIIRLLSFPDFEAEVVGVANDIKKNHQTEIDNVVILARNRRLLEGAKRALIKENMNAIISQRKDDFESIPFKWLFSLLCLANNRRSNDYLKRVCGYSLQVLGVNVDVEEIMTLAEMNHNDFFHQWLKETQEKSVRQEIYELIKKIWLYLGDGINYKLFIDYVLCWFDNINNNIENGEDDEDAEIFTQYKEDREVWEQLTHDIHCSFGEGLTLETFLHEIQLRSKEPSPDPDTVVLMTIHGAKGKEFDHVYLIGLVDDELPSYHSMKKGDNSPEMEEERRNCFVAITRTSKTLTLSYAQKYRGWPKNPSRFLYEMDLIK